MIKYSILYPYKDRVDQFYNTLLSLRYWYHRRKDWEVIAILDGKNERSVVPEGMDNIKQIVLVRDGVNPAPLFNMAAEIGSGEYIVISNPECYHASNVLKWFDTIFAKDPMGYAVAACDSVRNPGRLSKFQEHLGKRLGIFQHSTEHNVLYHYCSAMSREQWDALGGFDERFGEGYACEDDDFRDRVVCSGIRCYTDDSIKVLHQEHAKYKHTPEIRARYLHNLDLLRKGEAERGYKHDVNKFKTRK